MFDDIIYLMTDNIEVNDSCRNAAFVLKLIMHAKVQIDIKIDALLKLLDFTLTRQEIHTIIWLISMYKDVIVSTSSLVDYTFAATPLERKMLDCNNVSLLDFATSNVYSNETNYFNRYDDVVDFCYRGIWYNNDNYNEKYLYESNFVKVDVVAKKDSSLYATFFVEKVGKDHIITKIPHKPNIYIPRNNHKEDAASILGNSYTLPSLPVNDGDTVLLQTTIMEEPLELKVKKDFDDNGCPYTTLYRENISGKHDNIQLLDFNIDTDNNIFCVYDSIHKKTTN